MSSKNQIFVSVLCAVFCSSVVLASATYAEFSMRNLATFLYQHYHFRYGITVTQWVRFIKKGFDFDHTHPWGRRGCCQHIYTVSWHFFFFSSFCDITSVEMCRTWYEWCTVFRIVFSAIFHAQKITLFCLFSLYAKKQGFFLVHCWPLTYWYASVSAICIGAVYWWLCQFKMTLFMSLTSDPLSLSDM